MPDFHDPSTREQMEREGWSWDDGVREGFEPQPYFYRYICDGRTKIALSENGELETAHTHYSPDKERAWIDIVSFPMKSFAAAKEAADAILRGVDSGQV